MWFKMKILLVDGGEYQPHIRANTIEQLKPEMNRLDRLQVRWFIEDHNGNQQFEYPCAVHKAILKSLPPPSLGGRLLKTPSIPILKE